MFTSHRLVLRVPTDGALRLNFQYGQCFLVIDKYYVCLLTAAKLSVQPVFTSHQLVIRLPTDGALCPNFQYGQCLLVIV